jgi:chromosome segregation ATPase
MIEIELAKNTNIKTKGKENPVIRCHIKRDGNKSTYSIDGRPASKKLVMDFARQFSIQIDNLCQFLPQDRVVEFAGMTPVELLVSTQQAVGTKEMIEWHDLLKARRVSQRTLESEQRIDLEHLANLEGRQRMQEADVERMREREEVKERVRLLVASRPFSEYRDAKTRHEAAKKQRRDATDELVQLEAAVAPSLEAINGKQRYEKSIKKVVSERYLIMDQTKQQADECLAKASKLGNDIRDVENEKESIAKSVNSEKMNRSRLEGISASLRRDMGVQPIEFDVTTFTERIVSHNAF